MPKIVWLNGTISPLETATASVADHAYLYGDGLFEGIRFYGGRVFRLDQHLARLYSGAHMMRFEAIMPVEELKAIILDLCGQSGFEDGYIRVNVTRGTGLGLDPKNIDQTPNVMVMVSSLALYPPSAYDEGLKVVTSSFRVMQADTLDPALKCIGRYASNIMAKDEANRAGAGEGMMLNHEGYVAECTGDNLFIIKDGVVKTPHVSCGVLRGITRGVAIDLARGMGMTVEETWLTPYDVYSADEAFLTGTAAEVIPMVSLDARDIGDGKPGAITKKLMALFRAETNNGTAILRQATA